MSYPDRLSARPGERLSVMASADVPRSAEVAVVRLGTGPETAGVRETVVLDAGTAEVTPQRTQTGSFMVAPGARRAWPAGPFVAAVVASPTRLGRRQCLMSQAAGAVWWSLELDEEGRPVAVASGTGPLVTAVAGAPLVEGAWYSVAAGFDPAGGVRVVVQPLPATAAWRTARSAAVVRGAASAGGRLRVGGLLEAPVVVAARRLDAADPTDAAAFGGASPGGGCAYGDCYDGKLERPQLLSGLLDERLVAGLGAGGLVRDRLLVGWDFSERLSRAGAAGTAVPCTGTGTGGCEGTLWNTPTEAVTGHDWDAAEQDFRQAPARYGAVHFHADDLDDCRWRPTVSVELPAELRSGVYAVRFADVAGRLVDRAPFFVRPRSPSAPLVLLVPTASYLAYANDHPASDGAFSEATAGRTPVLHDDDLLLHEHREWGLSCYDSHLDGSGVGISTARRPLVNMRPTHRYHVGPWQFPADLAVVSWLGDAGIPHDVVTDEDLHREGATLLRPYRAVVSGTHPEYYSTAMLDGLEEYLDAGGRLAYLGANGYYWRVSFDPERPWVMELRRGHAGSRAWESGPGEAHLAFGGELGGLWRHLGRPPQRLVGTGYAAQGFDRSGWYRRLADSRDPRAAFVFEGVAEEVFGTSGEIGGGAVGQELDRFDAGLGTPGDALLLATSEGLTEGYLRCIEEQGFTVPGTSALEDPKVRADVVYHVRPGGGAVFAVGSIAWSGALATDPAVARITRNVLERFCDPAPLAW